MYLTWKDRFLLLLALAILIAGWLGAQYLSHQH
jgi:hypothetical protein